MFVLISTLSIKAQCSQACNLKITNKIDCKVKLLIKYTCGNGVVDLPVDLDPGNPSTPFIFNAPAILTCNCTILSVEIIQVNFVNVIGAPVNVPPGGTTVTFSPAPLAGCCPTNFAKYDGCNIELWMNCN